MIDKKILSFLRALFLNNNRAWFEKNRLNFEEAKSLHIEFIENLLLSFSKVNPKLKGLAAKDCVFRIYRDVRFSKNKVPYKTNFGAGINPGGKKANVAGVYLHIEPGKSFIAGGKWQPDAEQLKAIRQEIDYNTAAFKKILSGKNFKKRFQTMEDIKLKTAPKNYPKDHAEIELLKYTSFIVSAPISDAQLRAPDLIKELTASYKVMLPFLDFLNQNQ
jgi:uncharacterized protein (TIGR02453 family)